MRGTLRCALFILCSCATRTIDTPPPPAVQPAGFDSDAPLLFDPECETGQLENGLTWYIEENAQPEHRIELRLFVKAGAIQEDEDQLGGAHYVEHMAFNGTEHFPGNALIQWLESVGMSFGPHVNAYTTADETVYQLSLPTDDPAVVEKGLLALRDWAGGLTFDPTEFERERGVVIEEWRGSRGLQERMRETVLELLFHESRYGDRKTIGSEASLEAMELEALQRFYDDWYRPDLMSIAVVGDVDSPRLKEQIATLFGDLEGPKEPREWIKYEIPDHEDTLFAAFSDPEMPVTAVSLNAKVDIEHGVTEEWVRDEIIRWLTLAMVNQRLGRIASEPDPPFMAAQVAQHPITTTRGIHSLSASGAGDGTEMLAAVATELHRARVHGFSARELELAKATRIRSAEARLAEKDSNSSTREIAEIGRYVLTGDWMSGQVDETEVKKRLIATITLADVDAWIDGFLPAESRYLTLAMNADRAVTERDVLEATLARAFSTDVQPIGEQDLDKPLVEKEPQPGTVTERAEPDEVGITRWELSNGLRVVLKPTDFRQDEIYIRCWSWGGDSLEADATMDSAQLAAALSNASGAGPYDRATLQEYLAGHRLGMALWVDDVVHGVGGWSSPDDLDLALSLLHAQFTDSAIDEDIFRTSVEQNLKVIRQVEKTPETMFTKKTTEMRWNNHPRYRAMTYEDYERLDIDVSRSFLADRYSDASNFECGFVGAFEPSEIEPSVTKWLASLPSGDGTETFVDHEIYENEGPDRQVLHAGTEPKASVRIWVSGEAPHTQDKSLRFSILGRVLATELRERLREDLSGTYSVSVGAWMWAHPTGTYRLQIDFGCAPERAAELTDEVLEVLANRRENAADNQVVDNVTEQFRKEIEDALQSNSHWSAWLTSFSQNGWDIAESLSTSDERLETHTPEAVRDLAAELVDMDRISVLTRLPEIE